MSQDNKNNILDGNGPGKITAKGKTYDTDTGYLRTKDTIDNRFESAKIEISPKTDGSYETQVAFSRSSAPAGPIIEKEDQYFENLDIDGLKNCR